MLYMVIQYFYTLFHTSFPIKIMCKISDLTVLEQKLLYKITNMCFFLPWIKLKSSLCMNRLIDPLCVNPLYTQNTGYKLLQCNPIVVFFSLKIIHKNIQICKTF